MSLNVWRILHSIVKESRGAHQRLDEGCTERDDVNFLKHTLAFYNPEGAPRLEYSDVKITNLLLLNVSMVVKRLHKTSRIRRKRMADDMKHVKMEVMRYNPETDDAPHFVTYDGAFTMSKPHYWMHWVILKIT